MSRCTPRLSAGRPRIRVGLFITACGLFALNIYGLTQSLRHPSIYDEPSYHDNDISLTESDFYSEMEYISGKSKQDIIRLTNLINRGISHYWQDQGVTRFNIRIPIHENWLLFAAGLVWPEQFGKYEFVTAGKAIERGVGLCSQHAIILVWVLKQKAVEGRIVRLSGHVVVTALVDPEKGEWWVLDPDYGVIIPHDVSIIEQSPDLVRTFYTDAGCCDEDIDRLVEVYGPAGNSILRFPEEYQHIRYEIERLSYKMIWAIPLLLMIPFLWQCFTMRKRSVEQTGRKTCAHAPVGL